MSRSSAAVAMLPMLVAGLVLAGFVPATDPTVPSDSTNSTNPHRSTDADVPRPTGEKPSLANTGVPEGTELKVHQGDLTITRAGRVVDGLDVRGFITVKAPNVTIRRSVVRGGVATFNRGLITNYGYDNLLVEDVDIVPDHETVWQDGVKGSDFTLNRVYITGNVDSVKVHGGGNVTITNSLLENTTYFASDPNQGGSPTHNDGVQILDGKNITIVNNTIRGQQNMPVLGAANKGPTTDLLITRNWLDGGHCTVKLEEMNGQRLTATIAHNLFGPTRKVAECKITATTATSIKEETNRMESGGALVDILWVASS